MCGLDHPLATALFSVVSLKIDLESLTDHGESCIVRMSSNKIYENLSLVEAVEILGLQIRGKFQAKYPGSGLNTLDPG